MLKVESGRSKVKGHISNVEFRSLNWSALAMVVYPSLKGELAKQILFIVSSSALAKRISRTDKKIEADSATQRLRLQTDPLGNAQKNIKNQSFKK